ncbi:hypothetical protein EZV62_011085 [Acer yangbiense]|uniref:Uncharacterized protein n=1 Tax=Acer yangbiense TaxID=1000413 RepID=A0A5C7I4C2_9ROSI|nr:hypothetical protein EZV62_011085 [Acer yangbiense]
MGKESHPIMWLQQMPFNPSTDDYKVTGYSRCPSMLPPTTIRLQQMPFNASTDDYKVTGYSRCPSMLPPTTIRLQNGPNNTSANLELLPITLFRLQQINPSTDDYKVTGYSRCPSILPLTTIRLQVAADVPPQSTDDYKVTGSVDLWLLKRLLIFLSWVSRCLSTDDYKVTGTYMRKRLEIAFQTLDLLYRP